MRYQIYKSEDGGEYQRMQYVVFTKLRDAKRFVYELQQSAKLYLGLHETHYTFEIRRA